MLQALTGQSMRATQMQQFGQNFSSMIKLEKEDLTQQQYNIFTAIETNNIAMFLDMGGIDKVDLNFCTKKKNKPIKNLNNQ